MRNTDLSDSLITEEEKSDNEYRNASSPTSVKHTTLKVKLSNLLSDESLNLMTKTVEKKYTMNLMTLHFQDENLERDYREFLFEERNPAQFDRFSMDEICSWFSSMVFVYLLATLIIWGLALANKYMFHFERGDSEQTDIRAPFNLILNVSMVPWQLTQGLVFLLLLLFFVSVKISSLRSRLHANGAKYGILFGTLIIVSIGWCLIAAYYFGWGVSGTALDENVVSHPMTTFVFALETNGILILMSCQHIPTTFLYSLVGNFVVSFPILVFSLSKDGAANVGGDDIMLPLVSEAIVIFIFQNTLLTYLSYIMDRDLRKYFVQTNRLLDANMQVKIRYENPFSVDTVQAFGRQQSSQVGKFGSDVSPIGSWTLDFALVNLEEKIAEGGGGAVFKATYVLLCSQLKSQTKVSEYRTNTRNI